MTWFIYEKRFVLFILSVILLHHHYHALLTDNNSSVLVRIGRHIYLVRNGKKHAFADRYTMHRMGYHWGSPNMTVLNRDEANALGTGPTLSSLWDHHSNMKLLSQGNSKCIEAVKMIFPFSNPSIVLFKSEYVITYRPDSHNFRIIWIPKSILSYSNIRSDLLQLIKFNLLNESLPTLTMSGEDPRLYLHTVNGVDKLFVFYATRYPKKLPEIRMSYSELFLQENRISHHGVITFNYEAERGREDQKNWSPFSYGNEMYYISNGQPHQITKSDVLISPEVMKAKTVSTSSISDLEMIWKHGEIRGGTPATMMNGSYLTFFHSSSIPPVAGDVLRTYVFGAYLFEKDPPFAIKYITRHPIVHESMYSGPWTNLPESYYLIDYVAFPMSVLLSEDQRYIYLLYGHQDVAGWVAKINIAKLWESFIQVKTAT